MFCVCSVTPLDTKYGHVKKHLFFEMNKEFEFRLVICIHLVVEPH